MNNLLSKEIFTDHVAHLSDERLLNSRGWLIHEIEYPIIDLSFVRTEKRTLRLRINCENWNEKPPSIELLDAEGHVLDQAGIPQGNGVFNGSAHPKTGKPFICMIGSIEYHEHDSHLTDSWENYKDRSSYKLGEIITQIWNAWKKTT